MYEDVEVACATGLANDWWEMPVERQALLIARFRVRGIREAYEEKIHKEDVKERNVNRKGRGARR